MLVSQPIDPVHPNEKVFTLGTQPPLSVWVRPCPNPKCTCRAVLAVLTDGGPEAAQRLGVLVREFHDEGSVEIAARLGGVPHFFLTIESGTLYWHAAGEWMDVSTEERIKPMVPHVTGELLDEMARLWRRARGQEENPEGALLQKKSLSVPDWTPGALLAWDSLDLHLRMDLYEYDHQKSTYRAWEQYCPNPQCSCGNVSISFLKLRRKAWESIGNVVVSLSGEPPRLKHTERDAEMFHELWDAYQTRHPGYRDRLARRSTVMKTVGARFLDPARLAIHTEPQPAPASPSAQQMAAAALHFVGQLGLNDPCPCKSGRKYKNCCAL